jgi:hypothetical protein
MSRKYEESPGEAHGPVFVQIDRFTALVHATTIHQRSSSVSLNKVIIVAN